MFVVILLLSYNYFSVMLSFQLSVLMRHCYRSLFVIILWNNGPNRCITKAYICCRILKIFIGMTNDVFKLLLLSNTNNRRLMTSRFRPSIPALWNEPASSSDNVSDF